MTDSFSVTREIIAIGATKITGEIQEFIITILEKIVST